MDASSTPAPLPLPADPARTTDAAQRRYLAFELGMLFFVLPGIIALGHPGGRTYAGLLSAAAVTLFMLLRDPSFPRAQLWNRPALKDALPRILMQFAVFGAAMAALVWQFRPHWWLSMPREHPGVWALLMVGYPLLSVYPQNLVYRAFVFQRYRPLFGEGWTMIFASAAAFSFAHVVFQNWTALALTAVGGVFFALTYARTRSVLASSVEHALYGCAVFTVGLGHFLHAG